MIEDLAVDKRLLERVESEISSGKHKAASISEETKLSEATISRFRKGNASRKTIEKVCRLLKINTDGTDINENDKFGYNNPNEYSFYLGTYLWIRPIFDHEDAIGCYPVEIIANESEKKLELRRFVNDKRMSSGDVYINDKGYISILSASNGLVSLITLSSMTEDGFMFGAMLCLGEYAGNMYVPNCSPVVLLQNGKIKEEKERLILRDDEDYNYYSSLLKKVSIGKYAVSRF